MDCHTKRQLDTRYYSAWDGCQTADEELNDAKVKIKPLTQPRWEHLEKAERNITGQLRPFEGTAPSTAARTHYLAKLATDNGS